MKGVVTEIRGSMAALLSEEGCMVKVKNRSYEIGQEVEMKMKNRTGFKRTGIATAAGLLIAMGVGTVAYCTPAHYVSLDVNPSIEYKVNMFDRVIAVAGANQDGKDIIDGIQKKNLKNKDIKEAVALTVDKIAEEGYLQGEGSGIVIATTMEDEKDADELKEAAEKACEENECEAEVQAEGVGKARVERAAGLGITPGKLNLIEKLSESAGNTELTNEFINTWKDKSVKEIMAATKANKKEDKEQPKDKTNQNNGNDKANGNSNANTNVNSNSNGSENSDGKSTQNSNGKGNPENKGNIKGNSKGTTKN
jgi:hypothetical protein